MRATLLLSLAVLAGCTDSPAQSWVASFHPPGTPAGYTRFVTPTVKGIQPGDNVEYCQWVAAPSDVDRDVLDLQGYQSKTGHHAVMYATTETNFAVGESHECTEEDMLSISFMGAIGGEGTSGGATLLPAGMFFRLPKGRALMVNTHWLNATDGVVDGQAVLDVKFAPASADRIIADLFANNGDTFTIPVGQSASFDVNCVLHADLSLAMVGNHMHQYGTSVYTELVHADGTKQMLNQEPMWSAEEQFNPHYVYFSADAPMLAHAGDTFHTHCEWNNTTSTIKSFPDEMCTGIGFYFPSRGQITCENGGWSN